MKEGIIKNFRHGRVMILQESRMDLQYRGNVCEWFGAWNL
jgi:hypothetical protein